VRPRFGQLFKSSARWTRKGRTNQIILPPFGSRRGGFVVAATRAASSELLTFVFGVRIVCYGHCCWFDRRQVQSCVCMCMMGQLGFGL